LRNILGVSKVFEKPGKYINDNDEYTYDTLPSGVNFVYSGVTGNPGYHAIVVHFVIGGYYKAQMAFGVGNTNLCIRTKGDAGWSSWRSLS
jgi:hypothetical protein